MSFRSASPWLFGTADFSPPRLNAPVEATWDVGDFTEYIAGTDVLDAAVDGNWGNQYMMISISATYDFLDNSYLYGNTAIPFTANTNPQTLSYQSPNYSSELTHIAGPDYTVSGWGAMTVRSGTAASGESAEADNTTAYAASIELYPSLGATLETVDLHVKMIPTLTLNPWVVYKAVDGVNKWFTYASYVRVVFAVWATSTAAPPGPFADVFYENADHTGFATSVYPDGTDYFAGMALLAGSGYGLGQFYRSNAGSAPETAQADFVGAGFDPVLLWSDPNDSDADIIIDTFSIKFQRWQARADL